MKETKWKTDYRKKVEDMNSEDLLNELIDHADVHMNPWLFPNTSREYFEFNLMKDEILKRLK